jgi:eukaryotic-like serine/threonine-protein kinase
VPLPPSAGLPPEGSAAPPATDPAAESASGSFGAHDPVGESAVGWSATADHERFAEPESVATPVRYAVGAQIGQGGMARVYTALDRHLDRDVALKEARPGTEARLAREARVMARLDHPNIVPVHDAGRGEDGRAFYTMRLVRGRSLAATLAATPSLAGRLRYVRTVLAVAEAVAFAHSRGVVHRDLKPANILVGAFGETQVMDWGIARVLGAPTEGATDVSPPVGDAALTAAGGVIGTPRYMSPEQARGEPVDGRADVWGLGAVLYEVLAGAPPRTGQPADVLAAAREGRRLCPKCRPRSRRRRRHGSP